MKEIGLQNIYQDNIENLLREYSTYEVPFFQREYSWKKDEWTDFLEDALKSKENNSKHFFGFMTFRKESEDKIFIIEGQQRLTTIIILICLVRDIYFDLNDDDWKKFEFYIKLDDLLSPYEPSSPKLILSDMNKDFFEKYIQTLDKPEEKISKYNIENKVSITNAYIFECYKYFYLELNKKMKALKTEDQKEYLRELIKTILRNFIVVKTEVTDNKAAFNIFQTLNDRGLDLTVTDLLKIYLFDTVGNSWQDAKDKWDDIREALSQQNMNAFLRHFWLSKYSVIKEKDLLLAIEKKVDNKNEVFKFLNELKDDAEYYDALLNPSRVFWGKRSQEIVTLLEELQILSRQQPLPLLLASCREEQFHTNEFIKLLNICTNYIFRYLTIAERENKELERLFSDIAIDIRKGKIKDTREVKNRLMKEYVDDETFISIFSKKQIKSVKVAKYILVKIENYLSGETEKVNKRITLEHILPKSPNDDWKEYLMENRMEKEEFVYRIGNMTLLLQKPNKDATNNFFHKKVREIYLKETNLKINEDLQILNSWNRDDIQIRQEKLARIAAKVWNI